MQKPDLDGYLSRDLDFALWASERRPSTYWAHTAFAFWLTAKCVPRVFVELGANYGASYLAFCEAVSRLRLPTRCYAVDTWDDAPQVGVYGEEVYGSLRDVNYNRYGTFAQLLRKPFDEASGDFSDGSIDILHVGGIYTYDSARQVYENWRPKLSSSAVLLLHNTNERRRDFGVWRFLDELKGRAPTFEFLHAHGLGVVSLGADAPDAVKKLCGLTDGAKIAAIRERFSMVGVRRAAGERSYSVAADAQADDTGACVLEDATRTENGPRPDLQTLAVDAQRLARTPVQPQTDHFTDVIADKNDQIFSLQARVQELERSFDAARTAFVGESSAGGFDHQSAARWRRNMAQKMVLIDARARISALEEALEGKEEEINNNELSYVRRLACLRRSERSAALPTELTFPRLRSLGKGRLFRRFAKDYRTIAASPLFDEKWYVTNNPDVVAMKMDPVLHYLRYGSKQHRAPGPNFDPKSYLEANPDVASEDLDALLHFLSSGYREKREIKNTESTRVQNPIERLSRSKVDLSLAVPFQYLSQLPLDTAQPMTDQRPLAVLAHIFYEELAPEIRRYLECIPSPVDVFVSTTDARKRAEIEKTFANWRLGAVEVRIVANRGRDLAPTLVEFRDVVTSYELVLHIHSKQSSHWSKLFLWRDYLFETLLGDTATIESILDAFRKNHDLGMVAAANFGPVRNLISWGPNFEKARELGRRIGFEIEESDRLDFPSGSMFWARTSALRPLLDLNLTEDDFELEQGQTDGTLAHAIERLFFYCTEFAGFTWARIARREFLLDPSSAVDVSEPTYVDRFFHRYNLKLLKEFAPNRYREAP